MPTWADLIPTLSAEENIKLPLMLGGQSADPQWFDEVVGTEGLADRLRTRRSFRTGAEPEQGDNDAYLGYRTNEHPCI